MDGAVTRVGPLAAAVLLAAASAPGCGEDRSAIDAQWAKDQADLAECIVQSANDPRALVSNLWWGAQAALDDGRLDQAGDWAEQSLALASGHEGEWWYGNVIHDGHAVLGRVAVQRGDVEAAKRHLLAAGDTPGSPSLNSFGPNVVLCRDLLAHGEADTVLAYFDQCQLFWRSHASTLDEWRRAVARGEMPEFGANLVL